jgi:PP-loop superfamily ATP-utilizing enzyme
MEPVCSQDHNCRTKVIQFERIITKLKKRVMKQCLYCRKTGQVSLESIGEDKRYVLLKRASVIGHVQ